MNDHPADFEHLLAYVCQALDDTAAAAVATHLAACADCATTVHRVRLAKETLRRDATFQPPPALVDRAKSLLRSDRRDVIGRLAAPLRRVIAELTFDSRRGPVALAGFRGGSAAIQLAFTGGGVEVDLQLDPPAEPGSPWQMLGQVAAEPAAAATVTVAVAGADLIVARTATDNHGLFSLEAPPGRYDFVVTLSDQLLVLPNLEVG